jgi:hypothetical protein
LPHRPPLPPPPLPCPHPPTPKTFTKVSEFQCPNLPQQQPPTVVNTHEQDRHQHNTAYTTQSLGWLSHALESFKKLIPSKVRPMGEHT